MMIFATMAPAELLGLGFVLGLAVSTLVMLRPLSRSRRG